MSTKALTKKPADLAAAHHALAAQTLAAVEATTIEGSSEPFVAWARVIKDAQATVQAELDAIAKPLRKQAADHSKRYKPAITAYDQAYRAIKAKITQNELTRAEKAQAMLSPATCAEELPQIVQLAAPRPEGTHTTTRYSARVVDPSQVPRDFLIVDQRALDAFARTRKEQFAVAGCELVVTKDTTIR